MKIVPHLSQWKNGILDVITKCPILVIYENGFWEVLKIIQGCIMEVRSSEELAEAFSFPSWKCFYFAFILKDVFTGYKNFS